MAWGAPLSSGAEEHPHHAGPSLPSPSKKPEFLTLFILLEGEKYTENSSRGILWLLAWEFSAVCLSAPSPDGISTNRPPTRRLSRLVWAPAFPACLRVCVYTAGMDDPRARPSGACLHLFTTQLMSWLNIFFLCLWGVLL